MRPDLFVHTINALRFGETQTEASEALTECVDKARITGKPAKLTIELTIRPQGSSGQYFIKDTVKTKLPALPAEETMFFGTPDGNLTRDNPKQTKIELKSVDHETGEIKTLKELESNK